MHTQKYQDRNVRKRTAQRNRRKRLSQPEARVQQQAARAQRKREGPGVHYGRRFGGAGFDQPPLEGDDLCQKCKEWLDKELEKATPEEREKLEALTRTQAAAGPGSIWDDTRRKSCPSSMHFDICRMQDKTSRRNLVHTIRYKVTTPTPAMKHGILHEPDAVARFQKEKPHLQCHKSGLFMHHRHPWITATPGRYLDNIVWQNFG